MPNWQPGDWDFAYGQDRGFHDAEITDHAANFKTHFTAGRGWNSTHPRWSGEVHRRDGENVSLDDRAWRVDGRAERIVRRPEGEGGG